MLSTHQPEYNICYEPQWFYYYFDSLAKSSPQLVLRHSLNYRELQLGLGKPRPEQQFVP